MVGVLAVFGVWAYPKIPLDMMAGRLSSPSHRDRGVFQAPIRKPLNRRVIDKLEKRSAP